LIQTAKKILPKILASDASVRVKAEAFFHLTAAISSLFMVVFSVLLLPALIVRLNQGGFQPMLIDLPGIASSCSMTAFYLASQRVLYPRTWKRSILYLPLMMALGIGLSLFNTKAVLEALFGVKSDFVRTPKYNINGRSGSWNRKKYWNPAGWMPYLEIAFGLYFAFSFIELLRGGNYRGASFLLLFICGFLYTGVMSLTQRRWGPLRPSAPQAFSSEVVLSAAPAPVFPPNRSGSDRLPYLDSAPAVENGGETLGI
jgi:hypothetical protein